MFEKYFFISNYLLIILVGFVYWSKFKHTLPLKLFMGFLVYSFLTEVFGFYLGWILLEKNNYVYNSWNIVNHLFYSFFFLSMVANKKKRQIVLSIVFLYVVFTVINIIFFKNYLEQVLIYNIIFGSILIVFVIMIYYSELLNSDNVININSSLAFWISVGVLLSNIILIPVWVFAEIFSFQGIYTYLIFGSNIIMSICFITGFIVSKKEYNS